MGGETARLASGVGHGGRKGVDDCVLTFMRDVAHEGMQASASARILTSTYTLRVVLVTAIKDPTVGQHKA